MLTNYFLKLIGENIYKHQESSTIPYDYYVALSSTMPNINGENVTEPNALEYARAHISNQDSFNAADENLVVSNHTSFYFPESHSEWGSFSYYGIFDDPVGGNLLMFGEFESPINIPIRTMLKVPAEALQITVKNV